MKRLPAGTSSSFLTWSLTPLRMRELASELALQIGSTLVGVFLLFGCCFGGQRDRNRHEQRCGQGQAELGQRRHPC